MSAILDEAWQQNVASSIAHYAQCTSENLRAIAAPYGNPSVMYRPAISIDGNQWMALYGDNLQDGVAGFGDSPAEKAAHADDVIAKAVETQEWLARLTAQARHAEDCLEAAKARIEELRSDRDCEKRLRKDAEDAREAAMERVAELQAAFRTLASAYPGAPLSRAELKQLAGMEP